MRPSAVRIIPVPAPTPALTRDTMLTIPGLTAAATVAGEVVPRADGEPPPEPGAGTVGRGEAGEVGTARRGETASVVSPTRRPPTTNRPPTSRAMTRKTDTSTPAAPRRWGGGAGGGGVPQGAPR